MKFIVVIFLLLCNGLIYSQDQGIEIPDSLYGFFVYEVPRHRIIKRLKEYEKYSLEEMTTITSKRKYHLRVSSCRLYLGMDSSVYHFNEAYKISPKTTCSKMLARHNYFIKEIEEGRESGLMRYLEEVREDRSFSWYLWDMPNYDEFAFIDSCNRKYPVEDVEPTVKDSTLNSEIIRKRDQRYRSIGKLKEQRELDQINRLFIDSLYLKKGSLNAFDEEEIYQFSMVAHHSEDYQWAYKWMERLIDHYNSGYNGKSLLGPLLERMLAVEDGYCTKQDAQKRDYFIYMIKDKYPEFVAKSQLSW